MNATKYFLFLLLVTSYTTTQTNVRPIRGREQFEMEVLQNSGPSVVMFSNRGCGPCQQIKPHYKQLASRTPGISFFGVDTEFDYPLAQAYGVGSIPAFLFIQNGEVLRNAGDLYDPSTFANRFAEHAAELFDSSSPTVQSPPTVELEPPLIKPATPKKTTKKKTTKKKAHSKKKPKGKKKKSKTQKKKSTTKKSKKKKKTTRKKKGKKCKPKCKKPKGKKKTKCKKKKCKTKCK